MAAQPTNSDGDARKYFPTQFRISEQLIFDYCTNEIGKLLMDLGSDGLPNTAILGNPLRLVSLDGKKETNKSLNWTGLATALELNCTGKYLASSAGTTISIIDLHKGAILREFHEHDKMVNNITWHLTSPWLLASVGADCTFRTWDLRSHPAQVTLRHTTRPYRCLKYSPDCNFIACAGQLISIFDMNIGQFMINMTCNSTTTNVCFNPAECLLATSSEDHVTRFWDVDSGECVTQSPAYDSSIEQMHFAEDGRLLIVGTSRQISTIHWEPFELLSKVTYPVQMPIPVEYTAGNLSSDFKQPISPITSPLIKLLDMRVKNDHVYQLTTIKADSDRISTVLATISIEKLKSFGISDNKNDVVKVSNKDIAPICPTIKNYSIPNEIDAEIDDISPESETTTSSTVESMLDSLTLQETTNEKLIDVHVMPTVPTFKTSKQKSPNVDVIIKRGISSADICTMSDSLKYGHKIQQAGGKFDVTQKKHNTVNSLRKSLIRRGSSLNDMSIADSLSTKISTNTSVHASKNIQPRNHLQQFNKQSKFATTSISLPSSNESSNSTSSLINSPIDEQSKRKFEGSDEEDIEEFLHILPRIELGIKKQTIEIDKLIADVATKQENICEYIIEQSFHFEEPYMFSHLLRDYLMNKPETHNIGLNTAFLCHINALLSHRNKHCVKMALDFLEMVVTRFGDSIQHGLASKEFTLGVDVAAEQRFERSIRCKNALFQIRLNSAFITDRMDSIQRHRFENDILPLIDSIVNKTFKQTKN